MNDLALRGAVAAVRAWTRVYTYGLPSAQRDARRGEIDSDLWESVNDRRSDRRTLAVQVVARLIAGMPDDLAWRSDQAAAAALWRWRFALTVVVATVFALWLVRARTTEKLPDLPESLLSPYKVELIDPPPPPPPPPPPCPPAGFPQPPRCTR